MNLEETSTLILLDLLTTKLQRLKVLVINPRISNENSEYKTLVSEVSAIQQTLHKRWGMV